MAYIQEATRLRSIYRNDIEILIGLEIDWIRPSSYSWINDLLKVNQFDFFIGSVHHVHGIPIDFNHEMYADARLKSGGTDERLFEDYFDLQYEMLQALKPPIVGHFDLIRLKSDDPDVDFLKWQGVLQRASRNLDSIVEYGGLLELNSAALRKGMKEPYPTQAVCKVRPAHEIFIFSFDRRSSFFLRKEVDSPFRTIAITLRRLEHITDNSYSLWKILGFLPSNASEWDQPQRIPDFLTSPLVLSILSISKSISFSIVDYF